MNALSAKVTRIAGILAPRVWLAMLIYGLVCGPVTLVFSGSRPLWYDEVHTVLLSRLPTVGGIWDALGQGADLQPPTIFVAIRAAESVFGAREWAIRLPSTIGFLLMGICIIAFVSRRTNALWGLVAALFLLLSGVYRYAAEARPYGLLLGFAASAILCWQLAADGRFRRFAVAGLWASLFLSLFSHYYGFLVFIPLFLAEAVRTVINRRFDWAVIFAMLAATSAMFLLFPLLAHNVASLGASRVQHLRQSVLWDAYKAQLDSTGVMLALFAVLCLGLFRAAEKQRLALPLPEAVLAIGLLAVPVPAFTAAMFISHRMASQYTVILSLGAALVFAYGAYRLAGGGKVAALSLAAAMITMFAVRAPSMVRSVSLADAETVKLDTRYPDLPIVVSSGLEFAPAWYYASPELRKRIVFVADADMAAHYFSNDQTNSSIPAVARWFGWPQESFARFRLRHQRFLLSWTSEDSWMLPALHALGARAELVDLDGAHSVYLVTMNEGTHGTAMRAGATTGPNSAP